MIRRIRVRCRGTSPLLFNRMTMEQLDGLRTKEKGSKNRPRPKDPRDEAAPKVHQDEEGMPLLPDEMLFACLVNAGVFVRLDGKRQVSTKDSTTLPGFLEVEERVIYLMHPDDAKLNKKKPLRWEVDMRQGKNPNGGEAVCIVRPRFDLWAFEVTIQIDASEIDENLIRELFDKAGKRIGIGDFRPQKKGRYGKFVVECWDVVSDSAQAAE